MPKSSQIRLAVFRRISLCLGIAARASLTGLSQIACLPPCRSNSQPQDRICRSNSLRFIHVQPSDILQIRRDLPPLFQNKQGLFDLQSYCIAICRTKIHARIPELVGGRARSGSRNSSGYRLRRLRLPLRAGFVGHLPGWAYVGYRRLAQPFAGLRSPFRTPNRI